MPPLYLQIVFNLPLDSEYTYRLPDEIDSEQLAVGKRVLAPFRGRPQSGYLLGWSENSPPVEVDFQKISALVDEDPLFAPEHLLFYRRAAAYYQCPLGEALFALLPGGLQYRPRLLVSRGARADQAKASRSRVLAAVIAALEQADRQTPAELLALPELAGKLTAAGLKTRLRQWARRGLVEIREELQPPRVRPQSDILYQLRDRQALLAALAASRMAPEKITGLRQFFAHGDFFSRRGFLAAFSGDGRLLKRWCRQGWLLELRVPKIRFPVELGEGGTPPHREAVVLTPLQERVFQEIRTVMAVPAFAPFLLHGVTGSGKAEIYIKLIAEVLRQGRDALYLVPEIALTLELVERLLRDFGPEVAVLHSGLSDGERYDQWRRIMAGKARIVVGARSAVFAPLARPGLIIVDEEHEPSYKQESGFAYNGRDLALLRGQLAETVVVLGSATPALVSYHNAAKGRYRLLELPERLDRKALPEVEIIDLGREPGSMFTWDGFTPELLAAMDEVFRQGRQAMLFLNKRGFSRTLYCLGCGWMPECRLCSVHQTFHKELEELICHYCGGRQSLPATCPQCGGKRFFPLGLGIQKLEESLRRHFPQVEILRLDRDATRRKGELGRILTEFRQGRAQVLLGTQMLAKGHNFPGVDLVGVIFADLSLDMPEFTAPERTFQLLAQVAGRAGRGRDQRRGRVIVQTLQPEHYSITLAAAHDYPAFYRRELEDRRELAFPPFSYLANLRASGPDQEQVRKFLQSAKELGRQLDAEVQLLGPVPAAIVKVQNLYRWNLLVKEKSRPRLHQFLRQWRAELRAAPPLKWRLDIDPLSFF